ncbi:MAG TPA: hypothetical protein DDW52_12850 [Planctomycetaceae bacterium]|nr:hypothetical protein [Planctomycetaceae bacterium]
MIVHTLQCTDSSAVSLPIAHFYKTVSHEQITLVAGVHELNCIQHNHNPKGDSALLKRTLPAISPALVLVFLSATTIAFGQSTSPEARTTTAESKPNNASSSNLDLQRLDGVWLFVEDRTEGREEDIGGPPMSVKFNLRVEKDAVVYPRQQGDERITLDGSTIVKNEGRGSIKRYRGEWKENALTYTLEIVRETDEARMLAVERVFRATDEGLLVQVSQNDGPVQEAIYRHPGDIELPEPAKANIDDMAWLTNNWIASKSTSATEERWSPARGGAMLAVSRTVRQGKMVAFEYLRIVERDGGLVYIAQPAGREPTEFVLTDLAGKQATFVNPRHDYPQRIVYELSPEGTLTASIGFAKGRLQSAQFVKDSN